MSEPLKTGDIVYATYAGRTVRAEVILASKNGRSLVIQFETILGGHVGMMPVFQDEAGNYFSLVERQPLELRKGKPH